MRKKGSKLPISEDSEDSMLLREGAKQIDKILKDQAKGKKENDERIIKREERADTLEDARKRFKKTQDRQEKIKTQRTKLSAQKVRERVKEEKEDKKALEKQIKKERR